MRTRVMCDSCRQIYSRESTGVQEQDNEDDGLVTLSGLCPDCSVVLGKDKIIEP